MLSVKLIQLVQDHWEDITGKVIRRLREDPELTHVGGLPEAELVDQGQRILKNLDHWLASSSISEITERYSALGRTRFREGVPLHEAVRALQILKDSLIDFVREHGIAKSTVEIYAEEELEHLVGHFFDRLIYHQVRGYETALREATRLAASA